MRASQQIMEALVTIDSASHHAPTSWPVVLAFVRIAYAAFRREKLTTHKHRRNKSPRNNPSLPNYRYITFLQRVTPDNQKKLAVRGQSSNDMLRFGIGEQTDCPVFEDMFEFFQACVRLCVFVGWLSSFSRLGPRRLR